MEPLYLVAVIKPKAEDAGSVRAVLDSMMAATREEEGWGMYDLVVGDGGPVTCPYAHRTRCQGQCRTGRPAARANRAALLLREIARVMTTGGYTSAGLRAEADSLALAHFSLADALRLGSIATGLAIARELPVLIEIRLGQRVAYRAALPGTTADSRMLTAGVSVLSG